MPSRILSIWQWVRQVSNYQKYLVLSWRERCPSFYTRRDHDIILGLSKVQLRKGKYCWALAIQSVLHFMKRSLAGRQHISRAFFIESYVCMHIDVNIKKNKKNQKKRETSRA